MIHCFNFILLYFTISKAIEFDVNLHDKVVEGEQLYKELSKKAISYGECWKHAMQDIQKGCKHLTEDVQSRLALSFTNCFLMHSGSEPCPCSTDVPVADCLKHSSDRVFSTYTEFFTHTQSICHYLQHREWQEDATNTVMLLTKTSEAVSKKLDDSFEFQAKILDMQHSSLQEQKKLLSSGRILSSELQKSRTAARNVYNDFKTTASEQKMLLFDVFDRVRSLQNFVLEELSGIFTVAYYFIALILIYILTSMPRTANARVWLIIVMSLNVAAEKLLINYGLQEEILLLKPMNSDGPVYYRIWLCRKLTCLICLIVLLVFYYCYVDYNVINNKLLKEIREQNADLQKLLKALQFDSSMKSKLTFSEQKAILVQTNEKSLEKDLRLHSDSNGGLSSCLLSEDKSSLVTNGKISTVNEVSEKPARISSLKFDSKENLVLGKQKKKATNPLKPRSIPSENSKKKSSVVRSGISLNVSTTEISFELESPISKRYNLRSSSRVNSPLQSPNNFQSFANLSAIQNS